jgi:hypothetical protein
MNICVLSPDGADLNESADEFGPITLHRVLFLGLLCVKVAYAIDKSEDNEVTGLGFSPFLSMLFACCSNTRFVPQTIILASRGVRRVTIQKTKPTIVLQEAFNKGYIPNVASYTLVHIVDTSLMSTLAGGLPSCSARILMSEENSGTVLGLSRQTSKELFTYACNL